jgi:outer membrane phospholipase A
MQIQQFLKLFYLSTALLFFSCSQSTGALVPLISFPVNSLVAGTSAEFTVYFHNEGTETVSIMLPHQLQFLATEENGSSRQLSAFGLIPETSITLPPGSFHKKAYILSVPMDLQGSIRYQLEDFPGVTGVLLTSMPKPPIGIDSTPQAQPPEQQLTRRNLETLFQTYSANFSAYQPTYFLVGTEPEKSKFQISFKYRLFNPSGSLSRKFTCLEGFHLGYTQTSFWDLESDSAPFEDTSYKPELFYQTTNISFRPAWMEGFFMQMGIEHESNGRDGDFSRSTNYAYIKPEFIFFNNSSQLGMMISPQFLVYFNNSDNSNPDLAEYRGYFELETSIGKAHSLALRTYLRFAEKGPSFEVDLTYPIHRLLGDNLDIYFQIQYSNALAESLINYQDRVEAIRIGFALVR